MDVLSYMHARMHTYTHACLYAHIDAYLHTYTHTYTHAYTRVCMHTHTCVCHRFTDFSQTCCRVVVLPFSSGVFAGDFPAINAGGAQAQHVRDFARTNAPQHATNLNPTS